MIFMHFFYQICLLPNTGYISNLRPYSFLYSLSKQILLTKFIRHLTEKPLKVADHGFRNLFVVKFTSVL